MKQETDTGKIIDAGRVAYINLKILLRTQEGFTPSNWRVQVSKASAFTKDARDKMIALEAEIEAAHRMLKAYQRVFGENGQIFHEQMELSLTNLVRMCCMEFGVTHEQFRSANRKQENRWARFCFYATAKVFYGHSLTLRKCGDITGGRDHSTVLNGIKQHHILHEASLGYRRSADSISRKWLEGMKKAGL